MTEREQKAFSVTKIPFLFYDLIGRAYPGGYLILGLMVSVRHYLPWSCLNLILCKAQASDHAVLLATVTLGFLGILFVVVSSFLGFILGGISKPIVEDWIWGELFGLTLGRDQMRAFLGLENTDLLENRFVAQFGSRFVEAGNSLNRASFLCSYYIWKMNPTLGTMQGRWDSDLLAAQSSVLVSIILLVLGVFNLCIVERDFYQISWIIFLVIMLIGAGLNFCYHRKKRVFDRFAVFLTLKGGDEPSKAYGPE